MTVFDLDPELVYGTNSDGSTGSARWRPECPRSRINDPTGGPFTQDRYWLDDGDASTGVVSEAFIDDPYGSQPRWYTPDLDGHSADMGNEFATQREKRKAFTAFRQIQQFWDRFASRFTSSWSDIDLLVQDSDVDDDLGGKYSVLWLNDNEIRMHSDWLEVSLYSVPLYAPTHEAFHHFD